MPVLILKRCIQDTEQPFTVTLPNGVFEGYELDTPSTELQVTKSQLRQMYFDMTTIRYVALFSRSRTEELELI
jgi:hypothetical protein